MQASILWWSLACILLIGAQTNGDAVSEKVAAPVLRLAYGDFVTGELRDCDQPDRLRWQSPAFTTPFEFALDRIHSVHFPHSEELSKPKGEFCFELSGGDLLFGSLAGLSAKEAELDVPRFGRIHLQRSGILRLSRWHGSNGPMYWGPTGLVGWDESPTQGDWREEAGHIMTDVEGASIHGKLAIPAQAAMELVLSWTRKPNFILALGVDDSASNIEHAFRFEVWDQHLVVVQETDHEADLALLQNVKAGPGRIHLRAYFDSDQKRLILFSETGDQLANLHCAEKTGKPFGSCIRLINQGGDVRLERIHIRPWNGTPPPSGQLAKPRIDLANGSVVYGEIQQFDAAAKQFVIMSEANTQRIPMEAIDAVAFNTYQEPQTRTLCAILQDGVRLSGSLIKVDAAKLWLQCPGVREPLAIPVSELHALFAQEADKPAAMHKGKSGRLELDGLRLTGSLVDGSRKDATTCLLWQPRGSLIASPIHEGVSGQIVYREPSPPPPQRPSRIQQAPRRPGFVEFLFAQPSRRQIQNVSSHRMLYLRSGDAIPCDVQQVDERGLTFQTPLLDTTFLPHDQIKAVELAPLNLSIKLNKEELERLLTLPRMQKNDPPSHLIRSTNGDVLRCRLLEMDDKTCTVEVRLEKKQLQRDHMARIIWLHDDELEPAELSDPSEHPTPTQVQAVRSNGIRLTFVPEQLFGEVLSGASSILGACRINLADVDLLLIGNAIQQAAAEHTYQQWKLHHAREPLFVGAGSSSDRRDHPAPGTESALIGHPAPDFQLELLDGGTFRLSDHRGTVVVLDFWASWCGPCMQSLPDNDRIVRELEDQDVRLVTVNLQETPEGITSTLERLKLQITVVLDSDGVVANQYGVDALPHTVIIDGNGTIARLFIGGSPRGDHFRDALKDLLKQTGKITERMPGE